MTATHTRKVDERITAAAKGRFEIIAPVLELRDMPESRRFPHLMPDGKCVWTMGEAVAWCAAHNGLTPRTVWRAVSAFKKGGKQSLERGIRADKGHSRFFAHHRKAAALAAYLHLAWRPSVRSVYEAILRHRELIDLSTAKLPSYETVRTWLRIATPTLAQLAVDGQGLYRELLFADHERGLFRGSKDRGE